MGKQTKRRSLLKLTGGLVGTGFVTGCTGNGGGDGGDGDDSSDGGATTTTMDGDDGTDYPSEEIRNIVPFAAGGGFDAYARLIAPHWADQLGGDVVTENVTGGGSVIGGTQVYNADPDGHTMMIWAPSEGLPSQIGQDVGYDMREMSHIGFLTQSPATIIFREEAGIDTWEDMISSMGKLDWATQGVGTMAHVGMLILAELTGDFYPDDVNFVHFDGTGEVLGGLERGEANAFLINTATSGAKVIQAIEGTEMFLVFSNPDNFGGYLNEQGVEVGHWASELDVDGMEQMGRVASMRRFYTGPPDVPNDILRTQRDAFQSIINDDEFLTEAAEAGRPVIDPSDHTAVNDIIQESYELLSSEPYRSTLEEAF